MFEQELYNHEPAGKKTREGELFHNYEIKNWNFSPKLYKILAFSAILNIFALAFIGQTNLLTMRGCDSPFVGRVCQVLDTVYIGAVLFGTERDYVDAAYDRIDLGDAEITYIDISGETPPLSYPEGYFQIANPVQYAMMQQQGTDSMAGFNTTVPQFPSNPTYGNDLVNTPPITPKPNPNALQGDAPKSPFSISGDNLAAVNGGRKSRRGGRIKDRSNANTDAADPDETVANANTEPVEKKPEVKTTDPVAGVDINRRPLMDVGNFVNDLQEKKQVNLEAEFLVQAKGKLNKDGRLDPKTFKYEKIVSTDENMKEVLTQSIEAFNVAGYLQYLKELSGKDFNFLFQQDAENISAVVQSEIETEMRARSIKSALDLVIGLAKSRKTGADADQNDKDVLLLLDNAKVETDGKKVIIRFTVPKTLAHPMIQRKLAEQAQDAKKPSGNAQVKPNDNTAAK